MRAHLIDFAWQVGTLISSGAIDRPVVSLDPEASYELFRRDVPFFEAGEISSHISLWQQYSEITTKSLALTELLDNVLHGVDSRYAASGWKLFDGYHYIIKIAFDQLLYHADVVATLLDKVSPDEFECAGDGSVVLDLYGMFHPAISLSHALLKENEAAIGYKVVQACRSESRPDRMAYPRFSFGQPLRSLLRSPLGASFLEVVETIQRTSSYDAKIPILSVGCKELRALSRRALRHKGIKVMEYRRMAGSDHVRKSWRYHDSFKRLLHSNHLYRELTTWRGLAFGKVLCEVINFIAVRAEDIHASAERIFKFLDRAKPKMVIFQTMAPFYPHNVPIRWWCEDRDIEYACWMHGGYGANYSLAGYDVVDYRLAQRSFVYGDVVADVLSDNRCVLNQLGILGQSVEVAGSPFFDRLYLGRSLPNRTSEKERITLSIGVSYAHNQFYFGYDRDHADTSLWRMHLQILQTLLPFQDRYSITLKDYPGSPRHCMWRNMLDDLGANDIAYVSNELSFDDVLGNSDLNIFPWISTTFFQALYSDADIFVLETGDISTQAKDALAGEVFVFEDIATFCVGLREYLEKGKFCQRKKQRSRKYFLDWDHQGDRAGQLAGIVHKTMAAKMSGHAGCPT